MSLRKRQMLKILSFEACADCEWDFVTGEGERSCHYGGCPYLPMELDVRCPQCLYNFYTGEGEPGCGAEPTCDFARDEAPQRVETLHVWMAEHRPTV